MFPELPGVVAELLQRGWSQRKVLEQEDLELISGYVDHHRTGFREALVGQKQSKVREESLRGDLTLWLDPLAMPRELAKISELLESLRASLNEFLFLGLKDYQCHLALYPVGKFYVKHSDRHQASSSRVVSFVFYLHRSWSADDGGELILYDSKGGVIESIPPAPGTFVCFLSEDFPHEVRPAKKERVSLTGWIHNKELHL
ncbi:MAG TPA: 2OG-Fe(II) oxygenase [Bacteriovoracaceae bacterium]|nr:2OG-Fe(II) oxygenase [Bacteriovoracaceae bacterium]